MDLDFNSFNVNDVAFFSKVFSENDFALFRSISGDNNPLHWDQKFGEDS